MVPTRLLSCLGLALVLAACSQEQAADEPALPDRPVLTVLVTGATGTQGGAVARELLSRGHRVRALTRSPHKPAALGLATQGAIVMQGDFDDAASLDRAMQGADGVFAVTDFWEHGHDREVAHGTALIEAARRAGIGHFVYTSVAGADANTGMAHFDSKMEIENRLRESGLPYTVIRPVEFMDNWRFSLETLLEGQYRNPRNPDDMHQWIAAEDIGFFAGEAFDDPVHWRDRTEAIAGDQMTLAELVRLMSEVLDRPVTYEQVSWDEFEQVMGAEMAGMYRWFASDGYDVDIAALRDRYPELTTVREYLGRLDTSGSGN